MLPDASILKLINGKLFSTEPCINLADWTAAFQWNSLDYIVGKSFLKRSSVIFCKELH